MRIWWPCSIDQTPSGLSWLSSSQVQHLLGTCCVAATASSARPGSSRPASIATAREQVYQAAVFMTWLAERGRALSHCTQADVDACHGERYRTRRPVQAFLRWSVRAGVSLT